jgi:hypothetical protein
MCDGFSAPNSPVRRLSHSSTEGMKRVTAPATHDAGFVCSVGMLRVFRVRTYPRLLVVLAEPFQALLQRSTPASLPPIEEIVPNCYRFLVCTPAMQYAYSAIGIQNYLMQLQHIDFIAEIVNFVEDLLMPTLMEQTSSTPSEDSEEDEDDLLCHDEDGGGDATCEFVDSSVPHIGDIDDSQLLEHDPLFSDPFILDNDDDNDDGASSIYGEINEDKENSVSRSTSQLRVTAEAAFARAREEGTESAETQFSETILLYTQRLRLLSRS